MKLHFISEQSVRATITPQIAFDAVREAFIASSNGTGAVFPVAQGYGGAESSSFSLKSGYVAEGNAVGFKYGSYWPTNRLGGLLPSHFAVTTLIDGETGIPKAIVAASLLNKFRTAAADAVAVATLSQPDATSLGVVGAGHQAEYDVRAICAVRPIRSVRIWNRAIAAARALAEKLSDIDADISSVTSVRQAASAQIVVTITGAREALLPGDAIAPGTHISAMGSDQLGKQEIDPALTRTAHLFADKPAQSVTIGEFQHAAKLGYIAQSDIASIGDVLSGKSLGRQSPNDITIFDSSGIALQDILCAEAIYAQALKRGDVIAVDLS